MTIVLPLDSGPAAGGLLIFGAGSVILFPDRETMK